MSLVVNTNIPSLIAQNSLTTNTNNLNNILTQLSTGYRINSAADDPAGLVISEQLQGQINGQTTALQNAQDGVSILQIADGALSTLENSLQQVRQLTVEAANDTNSSSQRTALAQEIQALLTENDQIADSTTFNGISLLNGSEQDARLQIGANSNLSQNTVNISAALASSSSKALGVIGSATSAGFQSIGSVSFASGSAARKFLNDLDNAINAINTRRSTIGAFENEMTNVTSNLSLNITNSTAAESRIKDLNIASATATMTQDQILQQASVSVLSQANQIPALALKLLGG
jgi:flagellin